MKFFMPTYAVALTLAVTSDMFEQASALACDATTVCTGSSCAAPVTDGTTAVPVAKPSGWTACTGGTKAYLKSLTVIADQGDGSDAATATDATKINVRVSKTSANVASTDTPLGKDASPACDNTYSNVGKLDATEDVKATISCTALPCAFKYKAVYECQAPAACDATVCTSDTVCPPVATAASNAATSTPLTKPTTLTCATGKFAYISKLQVFPGAATASPVVAATLVDSIKVRATINGDAVPTDATGVVAKANFPACANSFVDIGKSATANVKASIGCDAAVTPCNFKYKAEWACQPADSCALTTCKDCTAATIPKATPLPLKKPDTLKCDSGKFAYLSSLEVGATGTKTTTDEVTVAFTNGATTVLAATKDASVCDGKWTDVGKTAATADIQGTISCADATDSCDIKYTATWVCQAAADTPAVTTKSGVAGACPVAAWGTALVAAVAGANFAAPL